MLSARDRNNIILSTVHTKLGLKTFKKIMVKNKNKNMGASFLLCRSHGWTGATTLRGDT